MPRTRAARTTPRRRPVGPALTALLTVGTALAIAQPASAHDHAAPAAPAAPAAAPSATKARTVTFTAEDFSFSGPRSVPAGTTKVTLVNHGAEGHQAALVRLNPGATRDQYLAALGSGGLPGAAEVGTFIAGPNGAAPGHSASVTTDLRPGSYLVLCVIPSPDGTPHVLKGMVADLAVTPGKAATRAPRGTPTVHLKEFQFGVPKSFVAAVSSGAPIRVVNDGEQIHEMVVSKLHKGKTVGDIVAWEKPLFTANPDPLPNLDVAGTTLVAPGGSATIRVDLPKGRYALVCYLPDAASGQSHLHQGMAYPFTVR